MSHFICGFKINPDIGSSFESLFAAVVPSEIAMDRFHLHSKSSFLTVYGNKKILPNIIIYDNTVGSWLALIGTPLVPLNSEQHRLAFLRDFLKNPSSALRFNIEGNFAVFSYDASKDRFSAATDLNRTTPIFYTQLSDGALLSSHELPLAKFKNSEIDLFGFCQSIQLGITWESRTRFQNVHKMLAGQVIHFDSESRQQTERYWQPGLEQIWPGSLETQLDKWMPLLSDSVGKFYACSGNKPVFTDFTAGEDSRLILAQCHALGIPFTAQVTGFPDDPDVIIAKKAAKSIGFRLVERRTHLISEDHLLANLLEISLDNDFYRELPVSCTKWATDMANPLSDYDVVKYCGAPGGEAFRGAYYLRGKVLVPTRTSILDHKFFTTMKFLLDFHPGLLNYSNGDFLHETLEMVKKNLADVKEFPIGTQIDHIIRIFQTSSIGLIYRNPLYMPLATTQMTRSIYCLSPRYKQSGRLTRACTEILYPSLAFIKTQRGVPTVRKTIIRFPLFMPEYVSRIRSICRGALGRYLKLTQAQQWYYRDDINTLIFNAVLTKPPYCDWFLSSSSMVTGHLYNSSILNSVLEKAKTQSLSYGWVPTLGRIINQELALRWVYGDGARL